MTSITLNTGAKMPTVGLGLWKSTADSGVIPAVKAALGSGRVRVVPLLPE